ncbi:MAG: hypothetical protein R3B72_12860 [Polyangiaceae bacterium]
MVALTGCPEEESDTPPPPPPATTATPEPAPAPTPAPTALQVDNGPTAEGIDARIKAEVDNREPDAGFSGSALSVPKGTFTVATGWTTKKSGTFTVASAADGKTHFAAASTGTATPTAQLDGAASAMGLTDCKWAATDSATVGKDKLVSTVADGVCKKDGADVKAAYASLNSENILAMGAWAADGDANAMFNSFRSAKKAAGGGDASGIAACCAALQQNAASAPPQQKGAYLAAFGACNAVRNSPQGRAALAQVRALLAGLNMPAACR